jgi:hypothetical protein
VTILFTWNSLSLELNVSNSFSLLKFQFHCYLFREASPDHLPVKGHPSPLPHMRWNVSSLALRDLTFYLLPSLVSAAKGRCHNVFPQCLQ